jgi:hypothetical protein
MNQQTRQRVKAVAMTKGFKLSKQSDGSLDLDPYVYKFAEALLAGPQADGVRKAIEEVKLVRRFHFNHNPANTGLATGFNSILDSLEALLPTEPDPFGDFDVLMVTTAYEQGVGHAFRDELANPYPEGSRACTAWDYGREHGKKGKKPGGPT